MDPFLVSEFLFFPCIVTRATLTDASLTDTVPATECKSVSEGIVDDKRVATTTLVPTGPIPGPTPGPTVVRVVVSGGVGTPCFRTG